MNLKQAAHRLAVHYQTAYRWVRDGELAAVKVGNRYEISEAAIEQFLSNRADVSSPPVAPMEPPARSHTDQTDTGDPLAELRVLVRRTRMTAQPCFDAATGVAGSVVGDVGVLRLVDLSGDHLEAVSTFAASPEIRPSVVSAIAAAGSFPRSTGHWAAAERSASVHVEHHMAQDAVRDLFGDEGRFAGHGVSVLAAAVAPIFVHGAYVGGLLSVKSLSYRPFSSEEIAVLGQAAELCGQSHSLAKEFGRAWTSNIELQERAASWRASGTALEQAARDDVAASSGRPQALLAPDGSVAGSSMAFDAMLTAAERASSRPALLDRITRDARVRDVISGVAARVDLQPHEAGGPGAIVSAVRGADARLYALVVDLIVA